ncbi:MAG: MBL fold metallo-hydrolase [Albidovulum sp.]|nr:MBL fold metallo-hydrolase [Albidovulum sp.]MDE0306557.1 MBL fold metallo-hydrolase [Albidovulum sp.]MDE0533345.1 MBL fold metallo-hydrolase [Albidovulum sp.]
MASLKLTILGCGSSGGVPRLGGIWGKCNPSNPRNIRRRCSLLVERFSSSGVTRVLVDSSPDLRSQLLDAEVGHLDAVAYTHSHADHVNGLDDLRMVFHIRGSRLPVWADEPTRTALLKRFSYAFIQAEGSQYPPILELHPIRGAFTVEGAGGSLNLRPFQVIHGSIKSNGFRFANIAYLPDVSEMLPESWGAVAGLDCWIVDALQRTPHPTHAHLDKTLEWIRRAKPQRAVLTNMHVDLDYDEVLSETPENVEPAFDGMTLETAA